MSSAPMDTPPESQPSALGEWANVVCASWGITARGQPKIIAVRSTTKVMSSTGWVRRKAKPSPTPRTARFSQVREGDRVVVGHRGLRVEPLQREVRQRDPFEFMASEVSAEGVGEEFGPDGQSGSSRRWIIDPIDGTKNFVRGGPVWATLLALQDGEETTVGVVSAPALHRRWWASRGSAG